MKTINQISFTLSEMQHEMALVPVFQKVTEHIKTGWPKVEVLVQTSDYIAQTATHSLSLFRVASFEIKIK